MVYLLHRHLMNLNMDKKVKIYIKILAAVITIALAAQLTIEMGSIPITGQTLAILCWAFFLTPRQSIIALLIYLVLGILGAPIFADGAYGLEKLYGGSGGFLVGFVVAAGLVSYLNDLKKSISFISILNLTALGTAVILLFGVGRLAMLFGFEKGLEYGFFPFWRGAIFKILIGALLVWVIKKIISKDPSWT